MRTRGNSMISCWYGTGPGKSQVASKSTTTMYRNVCSTIANGSALAKANVDRWWFFNRVRRTSLDPLKEKPKIFDRLRSNVFLTESKDFAALIRLPLGHRTCDASDDRICSRFAGIPELSVSFSCRSRRLHPGTTDFLFPNIDPSERNRQFLFDSMTTPWDCKWRWNSARLVMLVDNGEISTEMSLSDHLFKTNRCESKTLTFGMAKVNRSENDNRADVNLKVRQMWDFFCLSSLPWWFLWHRVASNACVYSAIDKLVWSIDQPSEKRTDDRSGYASLFG